MKGRITTQTFLPRLQAACEREMENCPVVDGLVFTGTNLNDLMEPQRAGLHAARHAMVLKVDRRDV